MESSKIIDSFLGFCVADALGVPVEFRDREQMKQNLVTNMREYGTHQQPAGTWSDDSSMAFCLAESLCKGYDLHDIANNFVKWYEHGFWAAHGKVFDIGIATAHALKRVKNGTNPLLSGGITERDNGNGSLMRILPLIFYIKDKDIKTRYELVAEVSSITHAHIRAILGCFIYTEFALQLLAGQEKRQAYKNMQIIVNDFIQKFEICSSAELNKYYRILENPIQDVEIKDIEEYEEHRIYSSGYVVSTLEASIWCFLKTENYADAVLKAVNLGSDTDTVGCVTGGLAGLYYGASTIPQEWIDVIARKEDIINLAENFAKAV